MVEPQTPQERCLFLLGHETVDQLFTLECLLRGPSSLRVFSGLGEGLSPGLSRGRSMKYEDCCFKPSGAFNQSERELE